MGHEQITYFPFLLMEGRKLPPEPPERLNVEAVSIIYHFFSDLLLKRPPGFLSPTVESLHRQLLLLHQRLRATALQFVTV